MQPLVDDFFRPEDAAGSSPLGVWTESVRAYIKAMRAHLLEIHGRGLPARRTNEEHADLMDRLVRKLFRLAEDRYFETSPRLNYRLAVVAVGGYGRREMSFASDIDLLFVIRGKVNSYVETVAETISTRLWDARLTLGAATRTVRECMRLGRNDLTTLTSYLDARFLIGDAGLYAEFEQEVERYLKGHVAGFLKAKVAEQADRHERMGESPFLLQPNLRESVGGLRDYHTALWIAHAVRPDVRRPEHLLLQGFIDADELRDLLEALEFVWRARNQLHSGWRKDDRLHFEAQEQLAKELGFESTEEELAVERMMRSYYLQARTIQRVSQRVIDHALAIEGKRKGRRRIPTHSVEEGFVVVDGKLEIPAAELLIERPVRLLSALTVAQAHDVELSIRAQRLIRQHLYLVDDVFRKDPEAGILFRRVLSAAQRVYRTLTTMQEVGLLGAYMPEFEHLIALWQHDMYHTYTVDVHSLFLVEQLRRLQKGRFAKELPLAMEIMREVRDPVVLFLGCMLHDAGKGRGGSHSKKGADLVPGIGRRLGLELGDIEDVVFLVQYHLTMSKMAEQRDVHDPRQILKLGELVGTRRQLRNLYLLTIADIRSTSPTAWTGWKAGLLEALYRNTAEWLEASAAEEEAPRYFLERAMARVASTQKAVEEELAAAGVPEERTHGFLDSMPRRYLLNHGPREIAAHTRAVIDLLDSDAEVSVVPFSPQATKDAFWGLIVVARDRRGLLSSVAGVLAACGHNILAAQAYTTRDSLAVEFYQVDVLAGAEAEAERARARIEERLRAVLDGRQTVANLLAIRRPDPTRILRPRPARVEISNEESDFYTVIDVTTDDRRALLHDVTRTLSELGLDVVISRVATRAFEVADAFYVTEDRRKVPEGPRHSQIKEALLHAIRESGD